MVTKGVSAPDASGKNMYQGRLTTGSEKIPAGFETKSRTSYYLTSTPRYNDRNWHYVVVIYSGSSIRLYINGVLKDSKSNSPEIPSNLCIQRFRIGANSLHEDGCLWEMQMKPRFGTEH